MAFGWAVKAKFLVGAFAVECIFEPLFDDALDEGITMPARRIGRSGMIAGDLHTVDVGDHRACGHVMERRVGAPGVEVSFVTVQHVLESIEGRVDVARQNAVVTRGTKRDV